MYDFIGCLRAEWLKQRGSFATWMVFIGAIFTPSIMLAARLWQAQTLPSVYRSVLFWPQLWRSAWESAAIFLLPIGSILATSLITQIEYRNNAWKQVHVLPLPRISIYLAKLMILLLLLGQFLLLFAIGIWLVAVIPAILFSAINLPNLPMPLTFFGRELALYFLASLPIVALQYVLSLRFQNFMVPLGAGFLLWVASIAAISSKYAALSPFSHTIIHYLSGTEKGHPAASLPLPLLSISFFVLISLIGFFLFQRQQQKG
jgi:lantibiotic transport system permease protein